jgi:hypothetical protein
MEFEELKKNVDLWIKEMNGELANLKGLGEEVQENEDNIQHNYELIIELKEEFELIKKTQIELMRIINKILAQNSILLTKNK